MKVSKKIKVFIVDDSAVVRQLLQDVFSKTADIEVVGVASDPLFAVEKMRGNWPDVFILDVEMPRMDGISFLKKSWLRDLRQWLSALPFRQKVQKPPWKR